MTDVDEAFEETVRLIQDQVREEAEAVYSKKVLREANDPRNVGRMSRPDGFGQITGPCGDTMEFYLKVDNGKIAEINFWTDGCGSSIACGSMTTKLAKARPVEEAVTDQDIIEALDGLPEENLHCAKLAADTLHEAIRNYLAREE